MDTAEQKPRPVIGQKIYVPTELYVYRGEDDFAGGLATIKSIIDSRHLSPDHYNYTMVEIEERKGTEYNWNYILENQEKWSKQYPGQIARPDPDYDPEFNNPNADWK